MRERYSQILGVSPHASIDQVKKAYRKRAKELHPDVATIHNADQKFLEVKKAYEYLTSNNWPDERLSVPAYQYSPQPPTDREHYTWWVNETKRRAEEYKTNKRQPSKEYRDYERKMNRLTVVLRFLLLSIVLSSIPLFLIQQTMQQKIDKYVIPVFLCLDVICLVIFFYGKSLKFKPKKKKA